DTRHRMQVHGVLRDEAFEERGGHVALGDRGGELWIEVAHLGADAAVQHLFAVAALDGGFAFCATGQQEHQRQARPAPACPGPPGMRHRVHYCLSKTTAWAAMARPRPRSSMPSFVVALRPISVGNSPVESASMRFISISRGWIFGFSAMTVASTLTRSKPSLPTSATT